jgi:hypothetical protein
MKSKLTVPRRNPFVCLVLKKTGAGSHRKSNKAQRKQDKQQGYSSMAEHPAFTRSTTDRYRVPLPY